MQRVAWVLSFYRAPGYLHFDGSLVEISASDRLQRGILIETQGAIFCGDFRCCGLKGVIRYGDYCVTRDASTAIDLPFSDCPP